MTTTDELCRSLDERGVEYERIILSGWSVVWWKDANGVTWRAHNNEGDGLLTLYAYSSVTPEQAITATLGAGTCKRVKRDGDTVFEYCSECGGMLPRWLDYDDENAHFFCPNCRRQVVNE